MITSKITKIVALTKNMIEQTTERSDVVQLRAAAEVEATNNVVADPTEAVKELEGL